MKKHNLINFDRIKFILFYAVLFFLISAFSIKFNIIDYDLWARLIAGRAVVELGHPLYSDFVSYTPTHVWYDPEWLSSAFLFLVHKYLGVAGLIYLKAVSVFVMFFVISLAIKKLCSKESPYNIAYYFILSLITLQSGLLVFTTRCQIITFILLGVWIFLLEEIRGGKDKYLYLLPFIMLFWLNSHGGCIAGVGILFLYGVGEFLNKREYKKYFYTLFFVCLVFLINPWGIHYIKFIIDSAHLDRSWISEWQSPFALKFNVCSVYKCFLFATFGCFFYKIFLKKTKYIDLDKTKLIVLLVVAFLSVKYIKHIGLSIVIFSIYMYEDYYFIYNHVMEKVRKYLQIEKSSIKYICGWKDILIYFLIFMYSLLVFITVPVNTSYYKSIFINYPVYAMEFLKINNIKGKIFAPFYFGSYISYKYYPDFKIYMDGRQEQVYSLELFDEAMFFINWIGSDPKRVIRKYPPDIILIEQSKELNYFFKKETDYALIYSDYKFNIYVKNNLKKFNYIPPTKDKKYYIKTLFDTNLKFMQRN